MPRVYGYVRPYPGRLGKQVREFVEEQGFVLGPGMVVAAGATDIYASRWILRATMDLLVLPFHLHRGDGGQVLDAIGVLLTLPEDVDLGGLPVLMPVRAFSWGSSFQRRLELLKDSRPHLAEQLIIAHQDEIGSPVLATRLRRVHTRPVSHAPLVRSRSVGLSIEPGSKPPATVREPMGQWRNRTPTWTESILGESSRATNPVRPHGPPSGDSPSSRPSGTRRSRPPLDTLVDEEPLVSEPVVSGERAKSSGDFEKVERNSLVLPRLPRDLERQVGGDESARERFRRAAEIGIRTRRDAAGRKKR